LPGKSAYGTSVPYWRSASPKISWGKGDVKTAQKLSNRIKELGISYDRITTDDGERLLSIFAEGNHDRGKKHTVGIAGNKTPRYSVLGMLYALLNFTSAV
jgi:IS1 family transposase